MHYWGNGIPLIEMNGHGRRKLTKGNKNYGTEVTLYGHYQRVESG